MSLPDDTAPAPANPSADTAALLLSETDNRYDFGGLLLINRYTGKSEGSVEFTRDEIDMPGYVESVERGYDDTPWRTQRMWLTTGPST